MMSTAASIVLWKLINIVYALSLFQYCSSYVVKLQHAAAFPFVSHVAIFNVEKTP